MEKSTYTAIDYNSKENKVIEERIRNYYLPVKNTFEAVLYGRLNIPDSPRGLCADLIDVSRTISREFALVEEVFLWRHVIKPWFTPQRFNIEIVYFGYYNPTIIKLQGEGLRIEGRIWYQLWITDLDMNCIERYFKGYNEVKRWWLPNLQMWYVFFYRKNGGKIKGVLGRERTNNLLDSIL